VWRNTLLEVNRDFEEHLDVIIWRFIEIDEAIEEVIDIGKDLLGV
jgi:hypothetical protein